MSLLLLYQPTICIYPDGWQQDNQTRRHDNSLPKYAIIISQIAVGAWMRIESSHEILINKSDLYRSSKQNLFEHDGIGRLLDRPNRKGPHESIGSSWKSWPDHLCWWTFWAKTVLKDLNATRSRLETWGKQNFAAEQPPSPRITGIAPKGAVEPGKH